MIYGGFDTNDLTDRQEYVFNKLKGNQSYPNVKAFQFLQYCIQKNLAMKEYENYVGDCDWLKNLSYNELKTLGIDMNTLYKEKN